MKAFTPFRYLALSVFSSLLVAPSLLATPPSVSIGGSGTIKAVVGQSIRFHSLAVDPDGDLWCHNFDWFDPDGVWVGDGGWGMNTDVPWGSAFGYKHSDERVVIATPTRTGLFWVGFGAISADGSMVSDYIAIDVVGGPVAVSTSLRGTLRMSVGQTLTLSSDAASANADIDGHNFDWRDPDGNWVWDGNAWGLTLDHDREATFSPKSQSPRTISITPTRTGVFNVHWSARGAGGAWGLSEYYDIEVVNNAAPVATVSVDNMTGYSWFRRRPGVAETLFVRFKATDSSGNLAGIRPNVWNSTTGYFFNNNGEMIPQKGSSGEVVIPVTIDQDGAWLFWTDAIDENGSYASSGHWYEGFSIGVGQGDNNHWRDMNGDGLLDEIIPLKNDGMARTQVSTSYSDCEEYLDYDFGIDFGWRNDLFADDFRNFPTFSWSLGTTYSCYISIDFYTEIHVPVGGQYRLFADFSGDDTINYADWQEYGYLPNGGSGYFFAPVYSPDDLDLTRFYIVHYTSPERKLRFRIPFGSPGPTWDVGTEIPDGFSIWRAGEPIEVVAEDPSGQASAVQEGVEWKVLNSSGQVVRTASNTSKATFSDLPVGIFVIIAQVGGNTTTRQVNIQGAEIVSPQQELRVAKWQDAFVTPGFNIVRSDFVENEADRFKVRITDSSRTGSQSMQADVWTGNGSGGQVQVDPPHAVELIETSSGIFESPFMFLAQDRRDDEYPAAGIQDERLGDRSHRVLLGDRVFYRVRPRGTESQPLFAKTVPVFRKIDRVTVYRLRETSGTGDGIVSAAAVSAQWATVNERYSQVGLLFSTPSGDPADSPFSLANGVELTSSQPQTLLDTFGTPSDQNDIVIVYVNNLTRNGFARNGAAFFPERFIIMSSVSSGHTLAHELGHTLGLSLGGHPDEVNPEDLRWRTQLMISVPNDPGSVTGSRRFTEAEQNQMRQNLPAP